MFPAARRATLGGAADRPSLDPLTKRASEETCGICRAGGYRAALTGSDFGQGHAIMQMSVAGRSSEVHTTPPARERRDSLFEEFELWSDYDAYARPSAARSCPVAAGAITTQSRSIRLPFRGV